MHSSSDELSATVVFVLSQLFLVTQAGIGRVQEHDEPPCATQPHNATRSCGGKLWQRILADATPAADSEQLKNNTGYDAGATARSLKKVECSAQFGCLCPHLLTCTGWVGQVTRRQGIDTRDNKTSKSLNLTPRTFSEI